MFRAPALVIWGLLGLIASLFIVIIPSQITDDLKEVADSQTSCLFPGISPFINSSSIRTSYGTKEEVEVEVAVLITRSDVNNLSTEVEYDVTLKPMDDLYSTPTKVDSGRVTIKGQAIVSTRFSIPKIEAVSQTTWELEFKAEDANGTVDNSGLDRVYVFFTKQKEGDPVAVIIEPTKYW